MGMKITGVDNLLEVSLDETEVQGVSPYSDTACNSGYSHDASAESVGAPTVKERVLDTRSVLETQKAMPFVAQLNTIKRKRKPKRQRKCDKNNAPDLTSAILTNSPYRQDATWAHRLSTTVRILDDIPEHIHDILKVKATTIADDMVEELASMKKKLDTEGFSDDVQKVVNALEAIPDLMYNTFNNSFEGARAAARQRVECIIREVEASDIDTDDICDTMWSISADLQAVAERATEEAIVETQAEVRRHLEGIIEPSEASSGLLNVQELIVAKIPRVANKNRFSFRGCASDSVKHAVAAIGARNMTSGQTILNRYVSDGLVRAKVAQNKGATASDGLQCFEIVSNPSTSSTPQSMSSGLINTTPSLSAFDHAPAGSELSTAATYSEAGSQFGVEPCSKA